MTLRKSRRVQAKSKVRTQERIGQGSNDGDLLQKPVAKKSKTRDSYVDYAQLRKINTKEKQVLVAESGSIGNNGEEEVTLNEENYIKELKEKKSGGRKKRGGQGSVADSGTCHQCRTKTTREKVMCTNKKENGDRCQLLYEERCLRRRYAESFEEALANKEWKCPKCRGKCNCSLCRKRQGLPAIGLLDIGGTVSVGRGQEEINTSSNSGIGQSRNNNRTIINQSLQLALDSQQVETVMMNEPIYNHLMLTIVIEDNNIDSMLSNQEKITDDFDLDTSDSIDTSDITSQFLYPIVYVNNYTDSYIDLSATTNNYDTTFGLYSMSNEYIDFYQPTNLYGNNNNISGSIFPIENTLADFYPMSNPEDNLHQNTLVTNTYNYYKPIDNPAVAVDYNPMRVIAGNPFAYNPIGNSEYSYTNNLQTDKHAEYTFNDDNLIPIVTINNTRLIYPFFKDRNSVVEDAVQIVKLDDVCRNPLQEGTGVEDDDDIDWSKFPDGVCVYIPARS
ncbi:13032_t:CDS:1 [Ambispora gerdemannii]|uniref:13032_t:CDS:1 n=1 Tax=Ambispora gerdemannii TaxID=144530 RepID=A0A9N9F530_9GLOM|nr:13032_t:CDS:1 [Ambispora gerdemannii]